MKGKKIILVFIFFVISNFCVFIGVQGTVTGSLELTDTHITQKESTITKTHSIPEEKIHELELPSYIRLYFPENDEVEKIKIEEYLVGVMAGEMYENSPIEALKAVAVAARTYTQYMCLKNKNKAYDIVADHNFSQAYVSETEAFEVWGEFGVEKYEKMRNVINQTNGLILCADNEPICALYHASSYPSTESCSNIFTEDLPYLRGKSSIENIDDAYRSVQSFSKNTFNDALSSSGYPTVKGELLVENITNENQRCKFLFIKDADKSFTISGKDIRNVFDLKSTSFNVRIENSNVVFDVFGFGHGVGLSQNGAVVMANSGKNFYEILGEYYPETQICKTIYNEWIYVKLNVKNIDEKD